MKKALSWPLLWWFRLWARLSIKIHKPQIIGIAGSVGKSSTRNAVFAALKDSVRVKKISGNSETGVPLGILGLEPSDYSASDWIRLALLSPFGIFFIRNTEYIIVEMGIDEPYSPKNMEYLLTIVKPHIAVSLNVGATHTQQFEVLLKEKGLTKGSEESYEYLLSKIAEEDTKIITKSGCMVGIYNKDDKHVSEAIRQHASPHASLVTFGASKESDITFEGYSVDLHGTRFAFQLKNHGKIEIHMKGFVLPEEYAYVFGATILVGREARIPLEAIVESLEKNFTLPHGRGTILKGVKESVIIDSSYNASKLSMLAFLDLTAHLKKETKRPVALFLGDMRELGGVSKSEHEEVARKAAEFADAVYLVGSQTNEYMKPILGKALTHVYWFDSSRDAGDYIKEHVSAKSIILVKGSQNTIFLEEGIKKFLKQKEDSKYLPRQERTWLEKKNA